ncbi:unnamed protein product [Choristocarpus tenellus]
MNNSKLPLIDIILPYNLLAEKLVLGYILKNPNSIILISEKLPIEAFYLQNHQIIYKTALILYAEGKTVDYITLITWLQDHEFLFKIGGTAVVLELLNQLHIFGNLDEYIALIYDKYIRRSLIELGEEIIEFGYLTDLSLETIFSKIEQKFFVITEKKQNKNLISIEEGLTEILGEIEKGLKTSKIPGLKTSFIDFDIITQGFQNSDLIIIAGRPSMGKTAFAFNLAKNIARNHNIGIIFFSLEMTRQQLLYRLLASEIMISNTRLRSSRISQKEWDKLNQSIKLLSQIKLYIDDTPNLSIGEIKFKIKTLEFECFQSINLIIIDYLQLLEGINKNENRVQELSKITRLLKQLARDLNIPIIVLSQLSRSLESRINKRPILADLRESGCLYFKSQLNFNIIRKKIFLQKNISTVCWTGNYLSKQLILNVRFTGKKPIYKLETLLGWSILISSNHKILTNKGWKKVDQLNLNTFICMKLLVSFLPQFYKNKLTISWDKILKINYEKLESVYDLQIRNFSNYLTNHIIIHNSIEQDADIVIMLYRDDYYNKDSLEKDIIEIIISKHRNGPIGVTKLKFDSKYLRFFNIK